MFDLETEDYADTFVTIAECARVMNLSEDRVRQLIKPRVLRTRYAWGSRRSNRPTWPAHTFSPSLLKGRSRQASSHRRCRE
jgi:hypothetical protein